MTKELAIQMIETVLQILKNEKTVKIPKATRSKNKKKSIGTRWTPEEDALVLAGKNKVRGRTRSAIFTRRSDLKTGRHNV